MKICHSKFVDEEKPNSRKVIVICFIIENYFEMFKNNRHTKLWFSPYTANEYYKNITLYIINIYVYLKITKQGGKLK